MDLYVTQNAELCVLTVQHLYQNILIRDRDDGNMECIHRGHRVIPHPLCLWQLTVYASYTRFRRVSAR